MNANLQVRIEIEEEVFRYEPAQNGSMPLWCMGDSCIVRAGNELFASGLETIPGAKILHNVRWMLFRRAAKGWELVCKDEQGRTREPCPLAGYSDGRVFLSANPTLTPPDTYDGPAQPQVFQFSATDPMSPPKILLPQWSEPITLNEHSYRHFVADGENHELILFQNLEWDRAYWSFLDRSGRWSASGKLMWPWGAEYEEPQAIRICYCNVQLRDRAVYVWGTSDIPEPVKVWKEFKFKLTDRRWDYDFRRLFFSWTPDIPREPFRPWIEVANREKTAGHMQNCDLWVAPDGLVHLLWRDQSVDVRLRPQFFPNEKLTHGVHYAALRDGKVVAQKTIAEGGDGISDELPEWGRFHVTADGRLFVILVVLNKDSSGKELAENRLVEIGPDGNIGPAVKLDLKHPLKLFFTTTPRGGSPPSDTMELFGECVEEPCVMRYTRIQLIRSATETA